MPKHLPKLALAATIGIASWDATASEQGHEDYDWAEQLVHTYLYDGMLQVWQRDRLPWNRLLSVHACLSEDTAEALRVSYATNTASFIQSMQSFGEFENDGPLSDARQHAVADVAKVAFRLFSSAYAHGYARQLRRADAMSSGIHEELCGDKSPAVTTQHVSYPDMDAWSPQTLSNALQLTLHAKDGVEIFMSSLSERYDTMDALVYSHAYQVLDSYQALFFEVNSEANIASYASSIDANGADLMQKDGNDYAEFSYLTLTSGYHWGTLSVLAMLESEFPDVHEKVNLMAKQHIETVTNKQLDESTTTDS